MQDLENKLLEMSKINQNLQQDTSNQATNQQDLLVNQQKMQELYSQLEDLNYQNQLLQQTAKKDSANHQDLQNQIDTLKLLQQNSSNQQSFKLETQTSNTEKQPTSIGGGVKMAKKNVENLSKEVKTMFAKLAEHEVKMDQLLTLDDFNLYYNDLLKKLDGKVDKVEIFNVVDQTSQLKDMLDNIRQSQEILTESQQRIKESQEVLYMDHENTKQNLSQNLISARASATYNLDVSNAKDTKETKNNNIVKDVKVPKKVEEVKSTKEVKEVKQVKESNNNNNTNNTNNINNNNYPDMSI